MSEDPEEEEQEEEEEEEEEGRCATPVPQRPVPPFSSQPSPFSAQTKEELAREAHALRAERAALQALLAKRDAEILFLRARLSALREIGEEMAALLAAEKTMSPRRPVPLPPGPVDATVAPALPFFSVSEEKKNSSFPGVKLRRETVLSSSASRLAFPAPVVPEVPAIPEEPKLKKTGSRFFSRRKQ